VGTHPPLPRAVARVLVALVVLAGLFLVHGLSAGNCGGHSGTARKAKSTHRRRGTLRACRDQHTTMAAFVRGVAGVGVTPSARPRRVEVLGLIAAGYSNAEVPGGWSCR